MYEFQLILEKVIDWIRTIVLTEYNHHSRTTYVGMQKRTHAFESETRTLSFVETRCVMREIMLSERTTHGRSMIAAGCCVDAGWDVGLTFALVGHSD